MPGFNFFYTEEIAFLNIDKKSSQAKFRCYETPANTPYGQGDTIIQMCDRKLSSSPSSLPTQKVSTRLYMLYIDMLSLFTFLLGVHSFFALPKLVHLLICIIEWANRMKRSSESNSIHSNH